MLCSALVVTYLSETKMDVSVRLLKHAFSPGRHSSGENRFLAEIDRTEKRKQHPHLGPTSRTWLLALSWVFLLRFFNCCLLLLLIASYSPARRPWVESLITFNTCPLISNNCMIKWVLCSMYMLFPSCVLKNTTVKSTFVLLVGLFVKLFSFFIEPQCTNPQRLHLYGGRVAARILNAPRSDSIQLRLYHIIARTWWCQLTEEMKRLLLTNQRWQE